MDAKSIVGYFRKSVRLDGTTPVSDPSYNFTDDDLLEIINMSVLAFNPIYINVDELPDNETYFVILKAKQELYYRLATSSAPFYPIEAEGASLRKDYRFQHYMSLIRRVEQEFDSLWDRYTSNLPIQCCNVLIDKYHYRHRNYSDANIPKIELNIKKVSHEYVDLCWNKFDVFGGLFSNYTIYVSEHPIYDEDTNEINSDDSERSTIFDIQKLNYRVEGLIAGREYHVLVSSVDRNGLFGVSEKVVRTTPYEY